ncbi:MAG TPA: hypothetical protein DCS38_00735 [Ruminococcus sp.]|nr:hypothetical protein [Ruminococcus sp.]
MLITNDFPYRKQISNLWLNHNYGGRTQFAPTITIIGFALFTEFQAIDQCFFIQNLWFNHNPAGDQWSPLQKQSEY